MKVKKAIELLRPHEQRNAKAIVKLHGNRGNAVVTVCQNGHKDIVTIQSREDDAVLLHSGAIGLTIKYFMEFLVRLNPDAEIKLHTKDGESLLFIVALADDDSVVWLESESDNDMASEISARFEDALEQGYDELDVYMDMLEIGIEVDMVRRWMGDETAGHMEQFCKEHGLI